MQLVERACFENAFSIFGHIFLQLQVSLISMDSNDKQHQEPLFPKLIPEGTKQILLHLATGIKAGESNAAHQSSKQLKIN